MLMANVKSRCSIDASNPNACWIWKGAATGQGYPYILRLGPHRIAHRVVVWGAGGFRGEISSLPEVHHTCAARKCLNPDHLVLVTSHLNQLERSVRNALTTRLAALTAALKHLQPDHQLLSDGWGVAEQQGTAPTNGLGYQTPRSRLISLQVRMAGTAKREQLRLSRIGEVLEVDDLKQRGMSLKLALKTVGITRSTYNDWVPRMREWKAEEK